MQIINFKEFKSLSFLTVTSKTYTITVKVDCTCSQGIHILQKQQRTQSAYRVFLSYLFSIGYDIP